MQFLCHYVTCTWLITLSAWNCYLPPRCSSFTPCCSSSGCWLMQSCRWTGRRSRWIYAVYIYTLLQSTETTRPAVRQMPPLSTHVSFMWLPHISLIAAFFSKVRTAYRIFFRINWHFDGNFNIICVSITYFIYNIYITYFSVHCFEAVGWAAGRASGL